MLRIVLKNILVSDVLRCVASSRGKPYSNTTVLCQRRLSLPERRFRVIDRFTMFVSDMAAQGQQY